MYRGKFRRETRDVPSVQLKEALNTESKFLHHNQLSINNNLKQADLRIKRAWLKLKSRQEHST